MVLHGCNPSSQEAEAGLCVSLAQATQQDRLRGKKKKKKVAMAIISKSSIAFIFYLIC